MVERDERQINSLIRLIEDMLDVSRIRTGKLSLRPKAFDLSQLARGLVESFSAQAAALETQIELQSCEPVVGEWDEFRIEQVLANLLSNALRYGERKPIQVRVFERDAMAWVQVQDQGIGVSAANQQRIFQQFERVAAHQPVAVWVLDCTSPNRSSTPMAGAFRSTVPKARAPRSAFSCRWRTAPNKTPRRGQPLPEPGVRWPTSSFSRRYHE